MWPSHLVPNALQEKGSVMGKHRLSKEGHRAGRQRVVYDASAR